MFFKPFVSSLFFSITLLLAGQSFEQEGVSVVIQISDKTQKQYIVKRNIPPECKKVPITNKMLWTGSFAHANVPERCKSTYVHTKGKLLPLQLYDNLETYGEVEVLKFLKKMQTDEELVLIDSRLKKWYSYRTIPGAINIPFIYFKEPVNYEFYFEYALKHLGVIIEEDDEFDFTHAKTLVLFCNGPWCTQSPDMIYALLDIGYPAEKLKWYRGGMQDWLGAGMTSTREVDYDALSKKHL
jgi:rhodanese-related sulfurtransferase